MYIIKNNKLLNCLNNKMLEHDWSLTAPIYGLIGFFRSKLSDLTCPMTNICNRTVKQPIKVKAGVHPKKGYFFNKI